MGLLISAFIGVFIYCIFLIRYLKKAEISFQSYLYLDYVFLLFI